MSPKKNPEAENAVSERAKTNSMAELIKLLVFAISDARLTAEEMLNVVDKGTNVRAEFLETLLKYK